MIARTEDGWNLRPGDPTTVLGWIFRRRLLASSFDPAAIVGGAAGSAFITLAVIVWWRSVGKAFDYSALIMIFSFAAWAVSRAWTWRHPNAETHAALPTITDERGDCPVGLEIYDAEGRITGRDHGWVSFADGWLVYEGVRTSFSLTNASVHPEYPLSSLSLRLSDGRRILLTTITGAQMTFVPAQLGDTTSLHAEARGWIKSPIQTGTTILPPRQDHPEVIVERLAFPPVYCGLSLFLALMANWWGGMAFASLFILATVGCLLWFLYGLLRFWRDLPKLAR